MNFLEQQRMIDEWKKQNETVYECLKNVSSSFAIDFINSIIIEKELIDKLQTNLNLLSNTWHAGHLFLAFKYYLKYKKDVRTKYKLDKKIYTICQRELNRQWY